MSAKSPRPLGGTLAFLTAVGCATAVVDQDPGFVDPNAPPSAGATGGTGAGGTTGGTAPGTTGGTTSAGAPAGTTGGGAGMLTGNAGRTGTFGGAGTTGGRASGAMMGGVFMGGAGRTGSPMGGVAAAAGTGTTGACPNPRMPAQPGATQGNSGSFDTTEAVCFFVEGTFNTWNCSNLGGRTLDVNGAPTMCGGALPEKIDGGYYFEFGASTNGTNYTSFYWYTS